MALIIFQVFMILIAGWGGIRVEFYLEPQAKQSLLLQDLVSCLLLGLVANVSALFKTSHLTIMPFSIVDDSKILKMYNYHHWDGSLTILYLFDSIFFAFQYFWPKSTVFNQINGIFKYFKQFGCLKRRIDLLSQFESKHLIFHLLHIQFWFEFDT